jgi:Flp pilus assembly protein TadG
MIINHEKRRSGTTMVEMALVGPLALVMILGIVDIGLTVWSYNNISEAVREGGRYAQIHGSKYAAWYTGPPSPPASAPPASGPTANDPNVEKVVRGYVAVDPKNLTVLSSWPNGNNNPNSPVTVEATFSYSPLLVFGLGTLTLHTKTTMYINY